VKGAPKVDTISNSEMSHLDVFGKQNSLSISCQKIFRLHRLMDGVR
jgi:hypothetical protein